MVKLADLNPLGAAHEIAKLRHILQLQAAGNAVGAAGGAASAATRETALMVGKTLNKLLNSVVTGPILMRFLRSNPDLCVTLLDLLLQPLVPVISMAVGKALIGLVKKPDEKEGGLKMVQLFPPVWEKAGDESKARSRGLRVPGGAALMKGSAAAGGALMRGGSAGLKKVKKPPRLLSFRKSKSYGASSETVDTPSGASTGSDEEAAEHTLEGIDEKQPVTPRLEKQLVTLQTGGSTPQTPRDGAGPPRGEGEAAEEAATAAVVDGAAAGGAKAEESQKKKEALVTVECVERLNVQYSDLTPGRVIPELSVGLSSLGVMKAVGAFTRAGMGAGKGVAAAPGKGVRTVMPRKGKKTYEDGFEAGFVAAHHTGPNLAEAAANCLNATPGLNKCVTKPRCGHPPPASLTLTPSCILNSILYSELMLPLLSPELSSVPRVSSGAWPSRAHSRRRRPPRLRPRRSSKPRWRRSGRSSGAISSSM